MQDDPLPDSSLETPGEGAGDNSIDSFDTAPKAKNARESRVLLLWEELGQRQMGDPFMRIGTHMLSIALVLLVVWVMREFYLRAQVDEQPSQPVQAAALPSPTPTSDLSLPPFDWPATAYLGGIPRLAMVHTTIPSRPRTEVITYEVQPGDTVFGIAEKFGLQPQTILWGNYYTLADNPHALSPGQILNIMPSDGTYHKWSAGEGLNASPKGTASSRM
jgi:hypothetical protein